MIKILFKIFEKSKSTIDLNPTQIKYTRKERNRPWYSEEFAELRVGGIDKIAEFSSRRIAKSDGIHWGPQEKEQNIYVNCKKITNCLRWLTNKNKDLEMGCIFDDWKGTTSYRLCAGDKRSYINYPNIFLLLY